MWRLREVQHRDGCEGRKSGDAGSTHPSYVIPAFRHWPVDSVWGCSVSILFFIVFNALTSGPHDIPLSCLSPTAFFHSHRCQSKGSQYAPNDNLWHPRIASLPPAVQPPSWPYLDPSKLLTPEKMNWETCFLNISSCYSRLCPFSQIYCPWSSSPILRA